MTVYSEEGMKAVIDVKRVKRERKGLIQGKMKIVKGRKETE